MVPSHLPSQRCLGRSKLRSLPRAISLEWSSVNATRSKSVGRLGVVYKARHIVLDSPVAVKVLLKPQDPEAQRRFLQAAKLASLIRHPNTVYISDFGLLPDGRSYLVMEFLQGPTLSRVLSGGRLSVARACQIARQIADGLAAVHHKGIVHREHGL